MGAWVEAGGAAVQRLIDSSGVGVFYSRSYPPNALPIYVWKSLLSYRNQPCLRLGAASVQSAANIRNNFIFLPRIRWVSPIFVYFSEHID